MLRIDHFAVAPPCPSHGWPLYDSAATRLTQALASAALPQHSLMQRAGQAIADLARALAPHARLIWIACGPGNNGGDGLQAAACLQQWFNQQGNTGNGPACRVLVTCSREQAAMPSEARQAWRQAVHAGVHWVEQAPSDLGPHDLCIDALLGIGLRTTPAPQEQACPAAHQLRQLLDAVQHSSCPVLCVDIASGLDADTGQYLAALAPRPLATQPGHSPAISPRHTLSLIDLKPGLFTGQGRDACGQVWWHDLGVHKRAPASTGQRPQAAAYLLSPPQARSPRPHASHKGSFGDVAVLGGQGLQPHGQSMTGAAWLAALAALHAGAGRVMLALLDPAAPAGASPWPEIMLRQPQSLDWQQACIVCGCGGGQAIAAWLPLVLAQARRLVLDADALNAVAADPGLAQAWAQRAALGLHTIATPHPLEAARLLNCSTAQVQAQRLHSARQLAQRYACTIVLKGSGSIVASTSTSTSGNDNDNDNDSLCWINPRGNARLATGGTGDVLAGLIGALWAQGMGPAEAACQAVYRHGAVADTWPDERPWSASALAQHLYSA